VWREGFVGLGASVAARQLGTLFVWITNAPDPTVPDSFVVVEVPAIPDFPYLIGAGVKLIPGSNFPYGYAVSPP